MPFNSFLPLLSDQSNLSDAQWQRVQSASRLPEEARSWIGRAITFYRIGSASVPTVTQTRAALGEAELRANALHLKLTELKANHRANLWLCLATSSDPTDFPQSSKGDIGKILAPALAELESLLNWLRDAQAKAPTDVKPGPYEASRLLGLFVSFLDEIYLEFCGRSLDRSDKGKPNARDYVKAVCHVADPQIGPGSIDAAMKHIIKIRRGRVPGESSE